MKSPRRAGVLRNMGTWENRKNEIKRRSEKSAGAVFVKKGSVMAALRFAPAVGGKGRMPHLAPSATAV